VSMRQAAAQIMEVTGFGALVAGVYLLAGTGVALALLGAGLLLAGAVVGR
jgi:hypothetical protein